MALTERDKTKKGYGGYDFHHADPQRRVGTCVGELLVLASADDIPPISEEAMQSAESAINLLAEHLSDRDFLLFFGCGGPEDLPSQEAASEAAALRRLARGGLRALLRVQS